METKHDNKLCLTQEQIEELAHNYGEQNTMRFLDHYNELISDLRSNLLDTDFQDRMLNLKPRGQITISIKLPKSDDAFDHVDRVWYRIQRSASREWFWVRMGAHLRSNDKKPVNLGDEYLARAFGGDIEKIIEDLYDIDKVMKVAEIISQWIYQGCYESLKHVLSK